MGSQTIYHIGLNDLTGWLNSVELLRMQTYSNDRLRYDSRILEILILSVFNNVVASSDINKSPPITPV